jgi:hypothetical protein
MTPSGRSDPKPENELEQLLVSARSGQVELSTFLQALVNNDIYVLSKQEVKNHGKGFIPLIFEKEKRPLAAIFTSKSRTEPLKSQAQFLVSMQGSAFLKRVPEGFGIVVNPGNLLGLEITPQGVQEIIRDFVVAK